MIQNVNDDGTSIPGQDRAETGMKIVDYIPCSVSPLAPANALS